MGIASWERRGQKIMAPVHCKDPELTSNYESELERVTETMS